MTTEQALQAKRRREARSQAMAISGVGMAQNQPVSVETIGTLREQVEKLSEQVAYLTRQRDESVAYYQELQRKHDADMEPTRRLLEIANAEVVRLLWQNGNQAQTIRVQQEAIARLQETLQNPVSCPIEPPLLLSGTNDTPEPKTEPIWTGERAESCGWKIPAAQGAYVRYRNGVMQWRVSIESGWVDAEKWEAPAPVHPAPNVTIAGGE